MNEPAAFRHPRLREIAAFLAERRDEVREAARAVPAERWAGRATGEGWSPAEILDHLRVVEHGIVRLMQKLVPELQAAGTAETETSSVLEAAFVARTRDRRVRIEAPARVMPTRAPDLEAGLAAMDAERTELLGAIAAADGLALSTMKWTHPALGPLNLYEWLVFVGAHEGRHADQLRAIAAEFAPRA